MVSPWNGRTLVPSFENESDNYIEIVVAERGDKALLQNGKVLAALAAKINIANAPKAVADKIFKQFPPKICQQSRRNRAFTQGCRSHAIRVLGREGI